ncbi:hypothetical protein BX616_008267, partial [Lobosporangium transversale]
MTSLDPFPNPKEVVFKGDLQTIDEQNAKFMELDYPTTEFWRTFAYIHAVDNDPLTCWNSFKVPQKGDSFGLRFVKPTILTYLTITSSKGLTSLEGQITVLASDHYDYNMHAGFSWMGTGSYVSRAKAQRLLEQRGNTTLSKERFKVIDMYFSIWTNQYPYQLVNYLTPLDQKNGWSTEGVNDHWSIVFRNMLDAADRLYSALLASFANPGKSPFVREEEEPYVQDRHT